MDPDSGALDFRRLFFGMSRHAMPLGLRGLHFEMSNFEHARADGRFPQLRWAVVAVAGAPCEFKIHQRGVQWKRGVVIYMMSYTSLLYDTTPIHCIPLPLHPPVMNTHECTLAMQYGTLGQRAARRAFSSSCDQFSKIRSESQTTQSHGFS